MRMMAVGLTEPHRPAGAGSVADLVFVSTFRTACHPRPLRLAALLGKLTSGTVTASREARNRSVTGNEFEHG